MLEVDVAIVGAGPTGLFAAYYAGFRGLSTAVIDALPEPGGQVTAMYPEKIIYDVAGFPSIKGRDLVANLVAQAGAVQPDVPARCAGRQAELPRRTAGRSLTLSDGTDAALRRGADHRWPGQLHLPPAAGRGRLQRRRRPLLRASTWTTSPARTWSSSAAATRPSTGRWRCSRWPSR